MFILEVCLASVLQVLAVIPIRHQTNEISQPTLQHQRKRENRYYHIFSKCAVRLRQLNLHLKSATVQAVS